MRTALCLLLFLASLAFTEAQAATARAEYLPIEATYDNGTPITKPIVYRWYVLEPGDTAPRFFATSTNPDRTVTYTKVGRTCFFTRSFVDFDADNVVDLAPHVLPDGFDVWEESLDSEPYCFELKPPAARPRVPEKRTTGLG